jgi:hypothetical protein
MLVAREATSAPDRAVRSCRIPRACLGQPGWRPVNVAAGWPTRTRVSARRSASGQPVPGQPCAGPGPAAAGIPAAVTNSGLTEDPRRTGTAWVAVRNRDLATPITGIANSAFSYILGRRAQSRLIWTSPFDRSCRDAQNSFCRVSLGSSLLANG